MSITKKKKMFVVISISSKLKPINGNEKIKYNSNAEWNYILWLIAANCHSSKEFKH